MFDNAYNIVLSTFIYNGQIFEKTNFCLEQITMSKKKEKEGKISEKKIYRSVENMKCSYSETQLDDSLCSFHFIGPNIQQTLRIHNSPVKYAIIVVSVLRSHW